MTDVKPEVTNHEALKLIKQAKQKDKIAQCCTRNVYSKQRKEAFKLRQKARKAKMYR